MPDIKWIKIATDIFDNRKIRQIESMPDGDTLVVVWLKILCLAGVINDDGEVYITRDIPYTEQTLATQFGRPLTTIQLALHTFQQFGMIEITDDFLRVSNWERYQNVDGMERAREKTRQRVQRCRERKRLSAGANECNATCNATVTERNGIELDIEQEQEVDTSSIEEVKVCAEQNSAPPEFLLPLIKKGETFPITAEDIGMYEEAFPAVDVRGEIRRMIVWLDANPKKKKTKNGIKTFVNTWLSREQDNGGRYRRGGSQPAMAHEATQAEIDDLMRRKGWA